ncbi:MAG TPA: hypothetical protein VOA41_18240 [Candidatus Dormibacteraeota bacterium]|nr:hypothetical protein [Candidatus Dormibacteraeota bacterium]
MKSSSRNQLVIVGSMFLLLFFSVLALGVAPQSPRKQREKGDPVLGHRIAKGVVLDGKLWLRGTDISRKGGPGDLISLSLTDDSRAVHFQRGVVDIEKSGHDLWVLRQVAPDIHEFVVSIWRSGRFEDLARFTSTDKDEPIVLLNSAGGPSVLSHDSLRVLSEGHHEWQLIALKGQLRWGVQVSVASPRSGKTIYVGVNRGEWGGGLQRVNVQTGVVTNVERRDTKDLCGGPLNSDCDPVTGVISDPQKDDCVLAAVGLVHLSISKGQILRVCGDRVTPIAEKPATGGIGGKMKMTEAFYGLAPAGDSCFWGITWRALYRFAVDGKLEREYPLPKLKPVSGVYLSRELPGVIVVRTDVNWAVSTSGYTPLLVPLEDAQTQGETSPR